MTFHFKSSNVQGSFTAFGKTAPVFFLEGSCNSYVMYKYLTFIPLDINVHANNQSPQAKAQF